MGNFMKHSDFEVYGSHELVNQKVSQALYIPSFDQVYIILKSDCQEQYKRDAKFDKNKKCYYLVGRTLREQSRKGTLSFLTDGNFKSYHHEKIAKKKGSYITDISYYHIRYILLNWDSFDWK